MADNRYTGNSAAYGFGKIMDEMDHRWDQGPQGMVGGLDQWTKQYTAKPQFPQTGGGIWQAESEFLRKDISGSQAPSSQPNPNASIIGANAADQSQKNIVSSGPAPTMPTLGDSLGSPITDVGSVTASVGPVSPPRAMQAPMDQRHPPYKYNAPNTDVGSGGTYSLPEVSVTGTKKSTYVPPPPMPVDKDWGQRMMNMQVAQQKGRQQAKKKDAAGRKITGKDSYYHAGSEKLYDQEKRDFEQRQADMLGGAGGGMPGSGQFYDDPESMTDFSAGATSDPTDSPSYDTGKRYSNLDIRKGPKENLCIASGGDLATTTKGKETADDWFRLSGIDMDIGDPLEGTGASPGFTEAGGMIDYAPKSLTLGSKIKDVGSSILGSAKDAVLSFDKSLKKGIGQAGKTLEKATPTIATIGAIAGTASQMSARSDVIGDLRDSVDKTEGMIGSLANTEYAEENLMLDEYTEGNRRIGEGRNLALGNRLDAVKGSNITSGTVKRIKEDLTSDFHRSTDLSLAEAADTYQKKRDQYTTESRDTRAKANEELKALRDQLKEQERQQMMAPFSLAADLAIGVVGVANPLVGMGLSAMKNKAFS